MKPLIDQARALIGATTGTGTLKEVLSTLLPDQKVLIFTYYSDTADYLYRQLKADNSFRQGLPAPAWRSSPAQAKAPQKPKS